MTMMSDGVRDQAPWVARALAWWVFVFFIFAPAGLRVRP
jgi:hypothetical protein